jgi:hypothetical protein
VLLRPCFSSVVRSLAIFIMPILEQNAHRSWRAGPR